MGETREYDLTVVLNYYAPYVSGLTEFARVVAEGLASRGWRVAVVTTRYDRSLSAHETIGGVDVIRCPVVARVSKGVVAPTFPIVAARTARTSGVVLAHLPMLEAGVVAALVHGRTPLAVTYHCDVVLGSALLDRIAVAALDRSSRAAVRRADAVFATSTEYAASSRVLHDVADIHAVPPPFVDRAGGSPTFRRGDGPHVGFLGRLVEEKGVEYLVDGFRRLPDPDARLLVGGELEHVAGGTVADRVRVAAGDDPRIELLGFVPESRLADFYASLDAFVLPSVNSLEAFGIVQLEAMSAGVPVVATDLPGVAIPVRRTGLGRIVPPRDAAAIEQALLQVLAEPPGHDATARLAVEFGTGRTLDAYAEVLGELRTAV